jgi:hypothetical protein
MISRISSFAGPFSYRSATFLAAGLYRTKYSGYYNDDVNFFATASVTATTIQTTVIEQPSGDAGDYYSMQWLGYFVPSTTETYTLYIASDDASHLWIGANAKTGFTTANSTINNGGLHGLTEKSATVSLVANTAYPIRIQFGENQVTEQLTFSYSSPTISKTTNVTGRVFYNVVTKGF